MPARAAAAAATAHVAAAHVAAAHVAAANVAATHPRTLQARSDPFSANTALLTFCLERGVVFQAYSVLGTQWVRPGQPNPVLTNPVIQVGPGG